MAYFEVDVLGGGNTRLDRATLIDSDNLMVAFEQVLDVLVWNATDTPVDIQLAAGSNTMFWVKDPEHYEDAQAESHVRSVTPSNNTPLGSFLNIQGLGPGEFFPVRVNNPTSGAAQRWLDLGGCNMNTSGHGTNIFNGQRVYVIGHRI